MSEPWLLDSAQVCELLQVSARWLRYGVAAGRIPGVVRIGPKAVRFDRAVLREWVDGLSGFAAGRGNVGQNGKAGWRSSWESQEWRRWLICGFGLENPVAKKSGASLVEVEDDLSLPAVRAVDAGRAALQRELLEVAPELRLQYAAAMAAVKEAERLVEEGEKTSRFLERKLEAAREIAGKLNHILNHHPRKLRELCADADLNREEHRLRIARNRAGEVVAGLRGTADAERLRWSRLLKAASRDFGVKGQDWEWSSENGFEVLRPGAGRSGLEPPQRAQVTREHAQALARGAEELALVEFDLAEAEKAWGDSKSAYERNRSERTWSVR